MVRVEAEARGDLHHHLRERGHAFSHATEPSTLLGWPAQLCTKPQYQRDKFVGIPPKVAVVMGGWMVPVTLRCIGRGQETPFGQQNPALRTPSTLHYCWGCPYVVCQAAVGQGEDGLGPKAFALVTPTLVVGPTDEVRAQVVMVMPMS